MKQGSASVDRDRRQRRFTPAAVAGCRGVPWEETRPMRFSIRPPMRALAALVAVLLAAPGLLAAAQAMPAHPAGNSTVTHTDAWEFQADYSTPDNVFLMHATLRATAFAYLETTEVDTTDVDAALEAFAGSFTGAFEPGSTHVVASGVTGDATAWRLYAASAAGIPAAFVATANVSAQPGTALLSLLMAPAGSFDMAFEDARSGIRIDGQPTPLAALDPAQLDAAIEGGADPAVPLTTPAPAPGTTVPANTTTQPSTQAAVVVDGVDYRSLDAPTGCDRVGWAITDPSQLPTTEPEVEHRAACAGGVSYVAKCGTVTGERTDTRYITCEITALVTDGPQEFGFDMFELFDADGDSEYVDFTMSFGKADLFPSGSAPRDATVSGTASFALDATATEPMLLEIRPPSLPAGADPAVIVIEGPLQELATFDQQGV
jgi:hypothetical protein